ncbi:MAG: nicotinate-nucleotide--dimethylbenzimidazole phosphoribosyltransferase [Gordonia sp. (in: high G+C Gram-positive bacteria)]
MRSLVLGGIRSGKSAHGERLVADDAAVRYLATGPVPDGDDAEWQARIEAHRVRRGGHFEAVETRDLVAELIAHPESTTLVDDLGSWVVALLDDRSGWDDPAVDLSADFAALAAAVRDFAGRLVLVSPEAGLSVVPATASGRRFTDALGELNSAIAAVCDDVVLVVAGRVLTLDAPPAPSVRPAPRTSPAAPVPVELPASEPIELDDRTADLDVEHAADFPTVDYPDEDVAEQSRRYQLTLTKPPGALGLLEDLGNWISACQAQCPPARLTRPAIAVFAGDHGVARHGVSAFPPEVTAQMVANIAGGGAAINVLARRAGAGVHVFDMSVEADTAPEYSRYKVRRSTGDLRRGEAMTLDEARRSVAAGRAVADRLVDEGADLLIAGDMGIGNTTPAAVLIGTLTGQEPVVVVGRGTGIDDAAWIRKTAAIRDGMRFGRKHRNDPIALLAAVAGPDLAAMAGFYAQAAVRRTPVLLDGVVTTSAAMVAEKLAPGASAWWRAGHRSTEPAHGFALTELGLEPIVDLSMRLGEGSGAATALPIVCDAVDVLIDMATFGEAGVSDGA